MKTCETKRIGEIETTNCECDQSTLREQLAMAALQSGLMPFNLKTEIEHNAEWCYEMADAMLKERDK